MKPETREDKIIRLCIAACFFALLIGLSNCQYAQASGNYCEGFYQGYDDGYCYNDQNYCIKPIQPICPWPEIGRDQFVDGYQRGFLQGLHDNQDNANPVF